MNLDSDAPLEREDERKRPAFSGYVRTSNMAGLTAKMGEHWKREAEAHFKRNQKLAQWLNDRDDSLVYSDFTPLDDPEPIQRDLFK